MKIGNVTQNVTRIGGETMSNLHYLFDSASKMLEDLDFCREEIIAVSWRRDKNGAKLQIHLSQNVDIAGEAIALREEINTQMIDDSHGRLSFTHDGVEYYQLHTID